MKAQHTPGLWSCPHVDDECSTWQFWVLDDDGQLVARVADEMLGGSEISKANARLITAAPDLLEACQTLAEWFAREEDFAIDFAERVELCSLAQKQVLAAIAKATRSTT